MSWIEKAVKEMLKKGKTKAEIKFSLALNESEYKRLKL